MDTKLVHKRSNVPAKVPLPANLELGELALNTADGRLFTKKSDGAVVELSASPAQVTSVSAGNEIRIAKIVRMTRANYDALATKQADKLYIIAG